jgi:hypothetical protein
LPNDAARARKGDASNARCAKADKSISAKCHLIVTKLFLLVLTVDSCRLCLLACKVSSFSSELIGYLTSCSESVSGVRVLL